MNKFKPGDVIVLIRGNYRTINHGQKAIVREYHPDYDGTMSLIGFFDNECVYMEDDFELEIIASSPLFKAICESKN
jgi:hypothetical protein